MSKEIHEDPASLVTMIRNNEAYIRERQLLRGQRFTQLIELLMKGETTGRRLLDLAILAKRSLNEADGQPYYDFEQALKAHPGELVALKQTWEEPTVKYVMDPGHSVPTRPVSEFLFGVVRETENVEVSGIAGQFSYLESLLILTVGDTLLPEVQAPPYDALFFPNASGNWKPSLDPQNYWVGNVEVAQQLRMHPYPLFRYARDGDELYYLICRALGVECVDDDGQGRLAISDPNPNAPDPPPPSTD